MPLPHGIPQPMNGNAAVPEIASQKQLLSPTAGAASRKSCFQRYILSLPREITHTDGSLCYKWGIPTPLLLLLKKSLPEIKSDPRNHSSPRSFEKAHHPKKCAYSLPCAGSRVIKSSQRRGTRVTVTPSLNESVTYPASVCRLLSKEGTAHISGFHFLPLSLPAAQAPRCSLNFRAQF